jgi:hypothetical protein
VFSEVYITDFGTAKRFRDINNAHIINTIEPEMNSREVHRNLFFASKNYFSGETLSRRDDLISILYSLLLLLNPRDFKMKEIAL